MEKYEKNISYRLAKSFAIIVCFCSIFFVTTERYIYPKLGIYFSQDATRIKVGCAKKFIDISGRVTGTYTFIDGKRYHLAFIYLHNKKRIKNSDKEKIPFYYKRRIFENDLKINPEDKCRKVKYISIIDLGFWKKFYLYDYIQD